MIRAQSVYNLFNKKFDELPLTGAWYDAFGRPESNGSWLVYGGSGSGKSSFAQQLVKYFDEELARAVAYLPLEEGNRSTFQKSAKISCWREKGSKIQILPPAGPEEVKEWLKVHEKTKVLVVDTVQYWKDQYGFDLKQYFELKELFSQKLFVYMSHVKGNEPDGTLAEHIYRDADQKIFTQGFRATSKGRNFGPKGYYSIWPEREKKIWLTKNND